MSLTCISARQTLERIRKDLKTLQSWTAPDKADEALDMMDAIEAQIAVFDDIGWMFDSKVAISEFISMLPHNSYHGRFRIDRVAHTIIYDGNINVSENQDIFEMPSDLTVTGFLQIRNCSNLKQLPQRLIVKGSLWLTNCALTSLPMDLRVEGHMIDVPRMLVEEANALKAHGRITGNVYV